MAILCNNCKKENRNHAKFCVHCGNDMREMAEEEKAVEKEEVFTEERVTEEEKIFKEEEEEGVKSKGFASWIEKGVSIVKDSGYTDSIKNYAKSIKIENPLKDREKTIETSKAIIGKASDITKSIFGQVKDAYTGKAGKRDDGVVDADYRIVEDDEFFEEEKEARPGNYGQEKITIEKEIRKNPKDSKAWYKKGEFLYRQGKYEEALLCYDKVMEFNSDDFEAPVKKGETLVELGRYEDALNYYVNIIEDRDPGSFQYLTLVNGMNGLGKTLAGRKLYPEANRFFDKVLRYKPDNHEAWYNKGRALAAEGDYSQALICIDNALKDAPSMWDYLIEKGRIAKEAGDFNEAEKCYDKLIEVDPGNKSRYENLKEAAALEKDPAYCYKEGERFIKNKDYDKAITYFDRALKLRPEYTDAISKKGYALYLKGKYSEAEECYDKALELSPDFRKVWYDKAVLLGRLGKYAEAEEFFDKILSKNPNNYKVLYNKGLALHKQEKYEEALRCFDKSLEIKPDNPKVKEKREEILKHISEIKEI